MKTLVYLCFFFILLSCQKAPEFDLEAVFPESIGDWKWSRTFYPFETWQNDVTELDSEFVISIEKEGRVKIFRNNLKIDEIFLTGLRSKEMRGFNGELYDYYLFDANGTAADVDEVAVSYFILYRSIDSNKIMTERYPFANEAWPSNSGTLMIRPRNVYKRNN